MLVLDFSWLFVLHFMLELFCLMGLFLSIFNVHMQRKLLLIFVVLILKTTLFS